MESQIAASRQGSNAFFDWPVSMKTRHAIGPRQRHEWHGPSTRPAFQVSSAAPRPEKSQSRAMTVLSHPPSHRDALAMTPSMRILPHALDQIVTAAPVDDLQRHVDLIG